MRETGSPTAIALQQPFQQRVQSLIAENDLIPRGGHVVAGLSGGPDSLCLFHLLNQIKTALGFTISAVHVNHGLRGEASDADQQWVEGFCKRLQVDILSCREDVKALSAERGETPEEAGRALRYRVFAEAAHQVARDRGILPEQVRIAVAHNRNDQVETILMRLMRGTGTDGLAGMSLCRTDRLGFQIIRPLIETGRDTIEDYCTAYGLEPRRDRSNEASAYFRNRIRLELLPMLRARFGGGIETAILRLGENAAADRDYFFEKTTAFLKQHLKAVVVEGDHAEGGARYYALPLPEFAGAHPALRHRLIRSVFEKMGLVQDIGEAHLSASDTLIMAAATGKSINFPRGYRLEVGGRDVFFIAPQHNTSAGAASCTGRAHLSDPAVVSPEGSALCAEGACLPDVAVDTADAADAATPCTGGSVRGRLARHEPTTDQQSYQDFDLDALNAAGTAPVYRVRQPGDRIFLPGLGGRKKIQDLFVDLKIPRFLREEIKMLAIDGEILWIPGLRHSERYAVTPETRRIRRFYIDGHWEDLNP